MEIINSIYKILLMPSIICMCFGIGIYFFQKNKIYRYPSQGWLSVKENLIPEDIRNFIATNGKEVATIYEPKWGPHGGVYFDTYDKSFITHWQPLPEAPKDQIKLIKGK